MKRRYILAPQAVRDLVDIWRYLRDRSSEDTARRVEAVIRSKFSYLADFPDAGHLRPDLTSADIRFFAVYSCLIVYRDEKRPLQIVAILHGSRDVSAFLPGRI
jgi:plasmid stabilization system protein ParE